MIAAAVIVIRTAKISRTAMLTGFAAALTAAVIAVRTANISGAAMFARGTVAFTTTLTIIRITAAVTTQFILVATSVTTTNIRVLTTKKRSITALRSRRAIRIIVATNPVSWDAKVPTSLIYAYYKVQKIKELLCCLHCLLFRNTVLCDNITFLMGLATLIEATFLPFRTAMAVKAAMFRQCITTGSFTTTSLERLTAEYRSVRMTTFLILRYTQEIFT